MKIQEMIEAIKNGKKVRRECWSGDKFLYYVPSAVQKTLLLIKMEKFCIRNTLLFAAKMVMLDSILQLSVISQQKIGKLQLSN